VSVKQLWAVADPGGGGQCRHALPQSSHGIHCGQLILRKISKIGIGATRCQILRLKCTKFDFHWAVPQNELTALHQTPYMYLRGLLLTRGNGRGREGRVGPQLGNLLDPPVSVGLAVNKLGSTGPQQLL